VTDTEYLSFLKSKVKLAESWGFEDFDDAEVNPVLKPHQRATVLWNLRGGRRADFLSFGLGKTPIQLETLRLLLTRVSGRALIVCPLGVRQEFARDAVQLLGWTEPPKFIRSIDDAGATGIYLTNYETVRDGKIDPADFAAVSLDEAAILRGFGGSKTFRELMLKCTGDGGPCNKDRETGRRVRYRFVATATPSPNDYIELLAYAEFLGVMDISQAKTRFFKRDSTKADCLTLHAHKADEFWKWVASWALYVQKPSDLGFADDGYVLPPLTVKWHLVGTDHTAAGHEKSGQAKMFRDSAIGIQDASAEKRVSLPMRIAKLVEIISDLKNGNERPGSKARPEEAIHGAVSQASSEAASYAGGIGGKETDIAGTVFVRSGLSGEKESECAPPSSQTTAHQKSPASSRTLQSDVGAIRGDEGSAEKPVRDMRSRAGVPLCGPQPSVGSGEGFAVQPLQPRTRSLQGQPEPSHESSGLSDQLVIWCDLNDEQLAIERALGNCGVSYSSLTGAQDLSDRETLLELWREKKTSALLTKPTMYGAGVNLQQCHTMIFAGIGFKFCDFIQAIHREFRFLQEHPVTVHLIYTEAESEVRKQLERKWRQHNEMVSKMTSIIREFGLSHAAMARTLTRKLGVERVEITGPAGAEDDKILYRIVNNDCVDETRRTPADSVGLVLTSIPFSSQYEYSPNYADFGHSEGNAEFFQQMDFLTPELLRVLKPGRVAAVHVKDRIVPMGMTGLGSPTVYPFHSECIRHYVRHGFAYMGMKTIVTDVVRENNQTYRLGWTEQCKDGTKMGVGMPEYLLLFRKPPTDRSVSYADDPVVKSKSRYTRSRWQIDAHGFTRSSGNRLLTPEELIGLSHADIFKIFREHSLTRIYDFEHHVRIGEALEVTGNLPSDFMLLQPQSWSPDVWTDITRMLTLNGTQAAKGKEMHLCPMQFDLADRVIAQLSNPGDVVFDPFGGLMTVPYRAILQGRFGFGCELNPAYFVDGAHYCRAAAEEMAMPTLFSLDEIGGDAAVRKEDAA
jgi:hypothetical protein